MEQEGWIYPGVDPDRANVARIYDALLGGKHNFGVDRAVARNLTALDRGFNDVAKANRAFLGRAVRFLADAGIRQFIDIGSGIPTEGNVHEIARDVAPESRVVYVDIDPVAIAHSKAILAGDDKATIIEADLREPEAILGHPEARRLIDFEQPVGLLMVAMLHFIRDEENPGDLVRRLTRPLVSGSYLTISHSTSDEQSASVVEAARRLYTHATAPVRVRGHAEIRGFFDGFDLVEPGLVFVPLWRPDGPAPFSNQPERSYTYSVTLFRSLGGAVGVSVLGAVLANRVTDSITRQLAAAGLPTSGNGGVSSLNIAALPAPVRQIVRTAYGDATGRIFLISAMVGILGIFAAVLLRPAPLRTSLDQELADEPTPATRELAPARTDADRQ